MTTRWKVAAGIVVLVVGLVAGLVIRSAAPGDRSGPAPAADAPSDPPPDDPPDDPPDAPSDTPPDGSTPGADVLIGLGPTADVALRSPLLDRAPVRMLTTWFNQPQDLEWLASWEDSLIPETYAQGYAHHVIVFDGGESGTTQTPYGPACGLLYPLSDGFDDDMERLADIFAGDGPLYVTMFTEFQTYPCEDNQWAGSEAYYRALKDRYRAALEIFHQRAPGSKVALGWGGWQHQWDDPSVGGGRSLIPYFADVMGESDFQSFQAMDSDIGSNPQILHEMTDLLAPYGPVMLAHYLPDDESAAVWDADIDQIFTDDNIRQLTDAGLFAFSFMDPLLLDDPNRLDRAVEAVRAHGVTAPTDPRPIQSSPRSPSAQSSSDGAGAGATSASSATSPS